ncbi:unnamed protein product, partial [Rotaria magnacalcarata]
YCIWLNYFQMTTTIMYDTHVHKSILVFDRISCLIKYVSEELTKTDTFRLIIPLDCLKELMNDPIYRIPQVIRIDVYYDSEIYLRRTQRYFSSTCTKLKFCTTCELVKHIEPVVCDAALSSSNSIDRATINDIVSTIEYRLIAKQSNTSAHRSDILKQVSSIPLYGLPVKIDHQLDLCFLCPSCKLVCKQSYELECQHQQCEVCLNIQNSCVICSTRFSRDKVLVNQELQMKLQKLFLQCFVCEWRGSWADYEVHVKENHYKRINFLISSLENDENSSDPDCSIEINQDMFSNLISSPETDRSVTCINGRCIWEVSYVSGLKYDELYSKQKSTYSSSFYLFPNGYKCCLRLFINGDRTARDSYVSLFFIIMRGKYDANLRWPFTHKITFTLNDQSSPTNNNPNHISRFCWPDEKEICFQRPTNNMNVAYGFSKFVPLDLLEDNENRYVQNDTMFIKFEVDLLSERPVLPLVSDTGDWPNDDEYTDTADENLLDLILPNSIYESDST